MSARISAESVRLRVAETSLAVYHRIGDGDHAVTVRDHLGRGDTLACLTHLLTDCVCVRAVDTALARDAGGRHG